MCSPGWGTAIAVLLDTSAIVERSTDVVFGAILTTGEPSELVRRRVGVVELNGGEMEILDEAVLELIVLEEGNLILLDLLAVGESLKGAYSVVCAGGGMLFALLPMDGWFVLGI